MICYGIERERCLATCMKDQSIEQSRHQRTVIGIHRGLELYYCSHKCSIHSINKSKPGPVGGYANIPLANSEDTRFCKPSASCKKAFTVTGKSYHSIVAHTNKGKQPPHYTQVEVPAFFRMLVRACGNGDNTIRSSAGGKNEPHKQNKQPLQERVQAFFDMQV